jgi:tetratricopeptide (TPR) repeat protein
MRSILCLFALICVCSCKTKEKDTKADYLGVINLQVSGNEIARPHFEKGLLLLHSFEYWDARDAFLEAQQADPKMAMAYWGEAMTYNHPLWSEQDLENGRAALEKMHAEADLENLTDVEADFIEAVQKLYKPKTSKVDRDQDYMLYMQGLYDKYPENHEIAAFYSLSLLGSVAEGRNDSIYGMGAEVADKILKENANHPGALHYMIHSYDDPDHAELAIDAANMYAIVAPDASHALHMPSHIYVALGMWDEVVSSNENSYQASVDRMERKSLDNDARGYHAFHWLEYGYLQKGRKEDARKMVLEMEQYAKEKPSKRARVHVVFLKGTYLVETNEWDDPIANIEIDVADLNISIRAQNHFLNGMVAFKGGDAETLNLSIEALSQAIDKESLLVENLNDGLSVCSTTTRETPDLLDINESKVMLLQLKALRSWNTDDVATESYLKKSVDLEQSLSYSYGPPFIQKPTHELYAEWLVEQERVEEAIEQYNLALKKGTKRVQVLNGLKASALLTGNDALAEKVDKVLSEI